MELVKFKYRSSKPSEVYRGYFYWVENQEVGNQIWFAPTDNPDDMILLNENIDEGVFGELIDRLSAAEGNIESINTELSSIADEILSQIDLTPYLTEDDLEGYVRDSELEGYLTDGDLNGYVKEEDLEQYLKESDLEGYAREDDIPKRISELENDVDYLTSSDLEGYAKIGDIELEASDYEIIAEKVKLTWKVI